MEKIKTYLGKMWEPITILQSQVLQRDVFQSKPDPLYMQPSKSQQGSSIDELTTSTSDLALVTDSDRVKEPTPKQASPTSSIPTLVNPGKPPTLVSKSSTSVFEHSPFTACFNHTLVSVPLHRGFDESSFFQHRSFPDEAYYKKAMQHVGFKEYRHGQRTALYCINTMRKVLAIMPTGHGKSALFVLPALASSRIAVVIMPTISLQQDQFNQWTQYLPVRVCTSQAGHREGAIRSRDVAALTGPLILIVTPEKLCIDAILQEAITSLAQKGRICLFAIDEAHLVLEWVSFRPEFLSAADLLQKWHTQGNSSLLLLTATLTSIACRRLMEIFNFTCNDRVDEMCTSEMQLLHRASAVDHLLVFPAYKDNIFLDVVEIGTNTPLIDEVLDALKGYMLDSSIVYCRRRADNDVLANNLNCTLKKRFAESYHSSKQDQSEVVQRWLNGTTLCVCATIAFGMGINKPNVRLVIDADPSGSINTILQKIGRCGRDGQPAKAVLYYNCKELQKLLLIVARDHDQSLLSAAVSACLFYLRGDICKWRLLLLYFGQEIERNRIPIERCGHCSYCRSPSVEVSEDQVPDSIDYQPLILSLLLFIEHNRIHENDGKTGFTAAINHLDKVFIRKPSKGRKQPEGPFYSKRQILQTILELVQASYLEFYMSSFQGTLCLRLNPNRATEAKTIKHISTIYRGKKQTTV
ncbi:DNA helicase RecQ [Giardia lamblia P15]|uniref:DNA 3'-5' helicase n=1 Tax=Giardia intestinalis (strain P15) TaxID=658858 RepID=E1F8D0_GIAIA|nr:DNA helicase RecQ [Giardia lamblia P15]